MLRMVVLLAVISLPLAAATESSQSLDAANFPDEVRTVLDEVREACKEARLTPSTDPQAGVTIIDLDRDGSKDIFLNASKACETRFKGNGVCRTGGCEISIFKQIGKSQWKKVFSESVGDLFLSASSDGHFGLMALTVSSKVSDRCGQDTCDYLVYWNRGDWLWKKIQ